MTMHLAQRLAKKFNSYFTSSNSVDVPDRVSVPRDEWRQLYAAIGTSEVCDLTSPPAAQVISMMPTGWMPDQCAANYYKAGMLKKAPDVVPARVKVTRPVCSDLPFASASLAPGEYECVTNIWGAVSVQASNGSLLGLRLDEFEPIAWRFNDHP